MASQEESSHPSYNACGDMLHKVVLVLYNVLLVLYMVLLGAEKARVASQQDKHLGQFLVAVQTGHLGQFLLAVQTGDVF